MESRIIVHGLDFFDGTPILDIKPYRDQYRTDEFTVPEWLRELAAHTAHV
jgi:tRNA (Thr-GGU) A37 N-methylase